MKLTEAYVVKLIKKSIKQFMCCCVGSTIGEGEPEGLAREGAIYIDEEAPALYYFDGTEWVVLPGGGGGIESVVAGDNVTVDDTDPLNPIINAGGGLPFKTIVWTAYATAGDDDPADVVIDVKFNNTGRTVSYDTIDYSGFYLSGVFTEAYFIGMNQGSGLGGIDIGSSEWNRPNFGEAYIGIDLGTPNKLFKWSKDGNPDNAVTFKIEIYE